jgi:hypothetical protein
VPTVHRTLEPLCYDKGEDGLLVPKMPETILGLKVCDPACGSASFLVAALHYLTDALYRSLCHHRQLDDPDRAKRLTLPYGRPRTGKEGDELVPFPPDDSQRGDTFEDRVKALLRRHVVERCIYGVDINPLAVELARVSLWVETLDLELPFSFLDHKIKVGNSLVGCWLDRVEDYPLKAWEREGGDGKNGERTGRIEALLKGEKVGNRRSGDGRIKQEMREVIEGRFTGQPPLFPELAVTTEAVVAHARTEYAALHDLPPHIDPDERERIYREQVLGSPAVQRLRGAMDEWCAIWFWPTDEESLRHVPMPLTFHAEPSEARSSVINQLASNLKFFHWELEYPDVFTPERSGFDVLIGNPPWDVMKPNSQEFFSDPDPLYRTYDKPRALDTQVELFGSMPGLAEAWDEYNARFKALGNWARNAADPFDLALARGKEGSALASSWARHRQQLRAAFADPEHPFQLQGSADLNSYKMFAEVFWNLLRNGGRVGAILPTGIYSDFGTKDLRETLLNKGRIDLLYAFQNEKRVFSAAHHAFKQVALIATRGGRTSAFLTRFRMGVGDSPDAHQIPDDLLRNDSAAMVITPDDVRLNNPQTLNLVEMRSQRDLDIFRKIYTYSIRIGNKTHDWEITFGREYHLTDDSKLFPPIARWESREFHPYVYGRWTNEQGELALPVYQGAMFYHFCPGFQAFDSSTFRKDNWATNGWDNIRFLPRFLASQEHFAARFHIADRIKIALRDITSNTNERTLVCSVIPNFPTGHTTPAFRLTYHDLPRLLSLSAAASSLVIDYVSRASMSGSHMSYFVFAELPVPFKTENKRVLEHVALLTARLTFTHRYFAPEWMSLKHYYPELSVREWKHWWAVTEADRLRLRVEIDALFADLYGLDPNDFDWIVRDDPTDSKGFYRVDRQLPFQERLTGLAAAAFRALKEGKWSAEGAASLSNDEFFDLLGIPELTNAKAAHAKGLPCPLIEKRAGCHSWHPQNFSKDDPRHGWTWDHCWNDAVALLGSEEAVREYVKGKSNDRTMSEDIGEPYEVRVEPAKRRKAEQQKLF